MCFTGTLNTTDDACYFSVLVHEGELPLLVNGELGVHEALLVCPGLFDVSHMPLTHMRGVIARIPEDLSKGDFFAIQSLTGDGSFGLIQSRARGKATGHHGYAGRGTRWLGVHTLEAETFFSESRNVRCLIASCHIHIGHADLSKPDIIKQDVNDIGRLATVFFAQFGQFGIDLFVLSRPAFTVLGLEDGVLGIVNDFSGGLVSGEY